MNPSMPVETPRTDAERLRIEFLEPDSYRASFFTPYEREIIVAALAAIDASREQGRKG